MLYLSELKEKINEINVSGEDFKIVTRNRVGKEGRITFGTDPVTGKEDIKYVENVLKLLPYVDILFGNRSEFDVFINTVEAKLETSSSVIKNLRAMITGIKTSTSLH